MVGDPLIVSQHCGPKEGQVWVRARRARGTSGHGLIQAGTAPLVDLRMAISKRESCGIAMAAGGGVQPFVIAVTGEVSECSKVGVVDAVLVLIEQCKDFGGTLDRHIPHFEHAPVTVCSRAGDPSARAAQKTVHGVADNARLKLALPPELAAVCGAAERCDRPDVRPGYAVFERLVDHTIGGDIKLAINPVRVARKFRERTEHGVVVIVGIHLPTQAELVQVVHAMNSLAFQLGPAQGGQQHRCEDGDDRDDHQKFNEREGVNRRSTSGDSR